jgi:uncharacterized membrane protein YdjX (TVP38/TMEM64 family)
VFKFFKNHSKVIFLILSLALSVLIFIFRNKFTLLHGYGLFGLFVLSILGNATIIFPVPVILAAFVAGAVFNPTLVAIVIALGSTIGELTGYLAGYGGEELIGKDEKIQKVKKWMDKYGLWAIFVLAAIPNPLFDLAGIVAGATKVSVYKYFAVVFAGKLIKFSIFAFLGSGSVNFIDRFI